MKKLAYIITSPDWGGAERYVFDLAKSLKKEFEILVCSGINSINTENLLYKLKQEKIHTHQFKYLIRKISIIKDIKALFEIAKFYNIEKPDIIHLNSSKAGILGSLAKILSRHKPKIIYTVHGWVFLEPMNKFKKRLYILLERLASKFRDQIIVLSDSEKQIALDYKICKKDKMIIIKNAIEGLCIISKNLAREKLGLPQDKIIIGTIAGYYKTKGLKYLIKAGLELKNFDFVIIGDGPELNNYKLQIKNYKLNNFKLLGYKDNASQYLNAFDIFVLPSIKEGAPYVIIEAMYAGLPIVATRVGAVEEMLQNYKNKILINPGNIEELKNALIKIDKKQVLPTSIYNFQDFIEKTKKLYINSSV